MEGFWLIMGVWSLRELYLCTFWGAGKALLLFHCCFSLWDSKLGGDCRCSLRSRVRNWQGTASCRSLSSHPGAEFNSCKGQFCCTAPNAAVAGPSCLLRGAAFSRIRRGLSLTLLCLLFKINARLLVAPSAVEMMLQP